MASSTQVRRRERCVGGRGRCAERKTDAGSGEKREPPPLGSCSRPLSQDADEVVQVENAYYSAKGA